MTRSTADKCRLPQAFWRAAEQMGLSAPALLRQARLPANLHVSPHTWLTIAQYFALWRADEALSGDPAIGLLMTIRTENAAPSAGDDVGLLRAGLPDGLHRMARFKRLCTPGELVIEEPAPSTGRSEAGRGCHRRTGRSCTEEDLSDPARARKAAVCPCRLTGQGAPIAPRRCRASAAPSHRNGGPAVLQHALVRVSALRATRLISAATR